MPQNKSALLLQEKTNEFKKALDIYYTNILYRKFFILVSSSILCMQIISVVNLVQNFNINDYFHDGLFFTIMILVAYVLTDFINGIIHMYMDNNTRYKSIFGPFIAAFHTHHRHQQYKKRHALIVYFMESGSKFWLVFYLILLIYCQYKNILTLPINILLVAIGILSSFAEVSHYWCHSTNKKNTIISTLQKYKILLSKKHHFIHHNQDNKNYAFLNGFTDPVINIIAKKLYNGYQNNSDLHALAYKDYQMSDRS